MQICDAHLAEGAATALQLGSESLNVRGKSSFAMGSDTLSNLVDGSTLLSVWICCYVE